MHEDDSEEILEPVSKSQLKRDAHALQDMGVELTQMNEDKLMQLNLPAPLLEAVQLARKITKHGGRKRQLQYIGKLMRQLDIEPLREQLDRMHQAAQAKNAEFHRLEQWRTRLIEEGDDALTEILEALPHADRQHLRQLVRNARQSQNTDKATGTARALFRYLRELQESL